MKIKKLFGILLFFLMIIFSSKVYADDITSISIGIDGTYTIKVTDIEDIYVNKGADEVKFYGTEYEGDVVQIINNAEKKVVIKGLKKGNATITIKVEYKTWNLSGTIPIHTPNYAELEIKVEVKDLEKDLENAQKENEKLEDYYKTDIKTLLNGTGGEAASNQMLYLRSILFNDSENGNRELWNKFIKSTTSEQLEKWYNNMSYYLRNSDKEYQSIYYVLKEQIEKNKGNSTQSDVNSKLDAAGNAQQNAHKITQTTIDKLKSQIKVINGEDREVYENFDDVLENIGNYVPTTEEAPDEVYSKAGLILGVISNIGIIMSVLTPAILGIKYMLGSVEDKSEYKKDMIPYLIGSVLLFGIFTIVKILQAIGENINNI